MLPNIRICLATLMATTLSFAIVESSEAQDGSKTPGNIQRLRSNVFLGQWQILGPIPIEADGIKALDQEYFEDERHFRGGSVRFHGARLYTWKSVDSRIVDLRGALASGIGGENCVGYAWTQFISDRDQSLRMAIAHDDMCAVWLNADLVGRSTIANSSMLDETIFDVNLKKGVNSLLLKVTNGSKDWDFAVRFLPTDVLSPLVRFKGMPDLSPPNFPVVGIEFLGEGGEFLDRHYCSGTRIGWDISGAHYHLYVHLPSKQPSTVRFVAKQPGFADFSETYSWDDVVRGAVELQFHADRAVRLLVTDVHDGTPIQNARVWEQRKQMDAVFDSHGAVSIPDFQPTVMECWVSAPGYMAKRVLLNWPRRKIHKVMMTRGGCSVTGLVTSETGMPIANATIQTAGTSTSQFQPEFQTDQNGRFEMHGFHPNRPDFSATVSARGFLPREDFTFSVSEEKPTDVVWKLAEGVLISGKVTLQETGETISGVLVVGSDQRNENQRIATTTNNDGVFDLVARTPGIVTLAVLSEYHPPVTKTIQTQRGSENKVDLQLIAGVDYRGIVKDSNGRPLRNARVMVDYGNGRRVFMRNVRSNPNGEFVVPNMPSGGLNTTVYLEGYVPNRSIPMTVGKPTRFVLMEESK
ncbi:carboxypeptidase regulatory-like domain-containing protein [Rhodopirellula baltica]|uniref:Secreted protein n=1 Tax=Rhodopirellula baltica SWK14 TaxID=993516 RepID=L7CEW8_RHOBT|nr:carboxypeptidase regulatory-like domain-containing protein [Rhodopirellula baltica]ELP32157.1 secreted protein [Rhodopirellula baltica SWK14]